MKFNLILAFMATTALTIAQAQTFEDEIDVPTKKSIDNVIKNQFNDDVERTQSQKNESITEYKKNGKTYKIEIDPDNFPAYVLSDQDGNGNLGSNDTKIDNDVVIPEWTIGEW